jgi:hypothetical protein
MGTKNTILGIFLPFWENKYTFDKKPPHLQTAFQANATTGDRFF